MAELAVGDRVGVDSQLDVMLSPSDGYQRKMPSDNLDKHWGMVRCPPQMCRCEGSETRRRNVVVMLVRLADS